MTPKTAPRSKAFYDGKRCTPSESVGHMLAQLMMSMRREADTRMAQHGLTDAQWKPLWKLQAGQADTLLKLARDIGMDAGAMTRSVDRLVAKGLVERVRSESDRRVVHLRRTPAGDAAAAEVPQVLASVNNDFLRGFSEAEWGQLKQLVRRMLDNGQALQGLAPQKDAAQKPVTPEVVHKPPLPKQASQKQAPKKGAR